MSTFLVTLGVIVAVVAAITWLALDDPEQRATEQRPNRRARQQAGRSHLPPAVPAVPTPVPTRLAAMPLQTPVIDAPVGRARAGLALTVLVTFVGVTLALSIAGGIFVVAEGLRTAAR
ncbi:MAG TPA: hypothetical protein VM121_07270 [Acidimicrobiales bacterium]|nr:hypothetical protein [Acidimicrobiales bacterium]